MYSTSCTGFCVEKLSETNFYAWKQKMELSLAHKEVENMIDIEFYPIKPEDPDHLLKWLRKDKLCRINIELSLSDDMQKNARHTKTALEMEIEICNAHQRHTLLNKLSS
eukprot:IDg20267t1